MLDTLLLRLSLHFTQLYFTPLHYTCRHFTSSHLNFTQLHFTTLLFGLRGVPIETGHRNHRVSADPFKLNRIITMTSNIWDAQLKTTFSKSLQGRAIRSGGETAVGTVSLTVKWKGVNTGT